MKFRIGNGINIYKLENELISNAGCAQSIAANKLNLNKVTAP